MVPFNPEMDRLTRSAKKPVKDISQFFLARRLFKYEIAFNKYRRDWCGPSEPFGNVSVPCCTLELLCDDLFNKKGITKVRSH